VDPHARHREEPANDPGLRAGVTAVPHPPRPLNFFPDKSAMLTALLVDDEPLANERMRSLLAAHAGIEVVGVAGNVQAARAVLESRMPDVVFLDVEMPGATGLELLPSAPAGTQVVFVTAREKYAVQAFDAAALGYLVKPVNPERLFETLGRLEEMASLRRRHATAAIEAEADDDDTDDDDSAASQAGASG
jgi:DNA-binding LytR/AlgR family response regulator